jgi:hypothetical protein
MTTATSPNTTVGPPAAPSHHADRYAAIADVLHCYYEGLYRCDTALLRRCFHPQARYVTASGGELLHLALDEYLPIVEARTSPERIGEPYGYIVESIDLAGPDTACVRMRSTMLGKHFIDFVSLIRVDGAWRIIAKVFHHEPATAAGASPEDH